MSDEKQYRDLRGANLYRANLQGANLHGADLSGALNREFAFGLPIASVHTVTANPEDLR